MQLHATPLSHFSRKVRILLAELELAYRPVWIEGVLAISSQHYGDHPLMKLPTLVDGDVTVFDSDHIARYLVGTYDPADRLGVREERVAAMNQLSVANGVMSNGVVLVLAKRSGVTQLDTSYFAKLRASIASGLGWLDATPLDGPFTYRDGTLVAMWDHLVHYELVPRTSYPRLAARVAAFADRPSVASTAPAAALAQATREGWVMR